ncbi:MAG TPA: septum site-determining protein MinC [Clostridiaceae bacterium]|nr:septum site-determining protein MinC [Clostridiaceae bacterium]
MGKADVTFKATINGLILILKEDDDFQDIYDQIDKKMASAGKFFKDASIIVKYRGKKLSAHEEDKIRELMASKTGAEIKSFKYDIQEIHKTHSDNNAQTSKKFSLKKFSYFNGIKEGQTKFYRGTVRSGQLISYDGNLVVLGDVNPGGEIEATGNVIVMGSLRGVVHAGADGNREAIVAALNLEPTQLRIADIITRSPDEKENKSTYIPEIAYVKDDTVYIERFLPLLK